MPTRVLVGLCKKKGLPDFGSIGANCQVELELDGQILHDDPDRFQQHVRRAYAACRESVEEELARERHDANFADDPTPRQGNGNGSNHRNGRRRTATESQVRAIQAIAGRHRIDLAAVLERYGVRNASDLTVSDASALIDDLKSQPNGDRR